MNYGCMILSVTLILYILFRSEFLNKKSKNGTPTRIKNMLIRIYKKVNKILKIYNHTVTIRVSITENLSQVLTENAFVTYVTS